MSQYMVEVSGQVHDWQCDEPFGDEEFQEQVERLMNYNFEGYGFKKGYSDLKVNIAQAGFSEEPNWEGNMGCMIYDVDISFSIDLRKYEMNYYLGSGLNWYVLSPALYLMPIKPVKKEFVMAEDYEELKETYPLINETIVIHQLVKELLQNSLLDYDGNVFDYWDGLAIKVSPIDIFTRFEYFMNWINENPFEVKQ